MKAHFNEINVTEEFALFHAMLKQFLTSETSVIPDLGNSPVPGHR